MQRVLFAETLKLKPLQGISFFLLQHFNTFPAQKFFFQVFQVAAEIKA